MTQKECCKTCNAFLQDTPTTGYCRARPPVPIMIGMAQQAIALRPDQAPTPFIQSYFPSMTDEGWCREWQMKTEGSA